MVFHPPSLSPCFICVTLFVLFRHRSWLLSGEATNLQHTHTHACMSCLQLLSAVGFCGAVMHIDDICLFRALPPGSSVFSCFYFVIFIFFCKKCYYFQVLNVTFPHELHLIWFVLDMLKVSRSHGDPSNPASDLTIPHAAGFHRVIRFVYLCRCMRLHQFPVTAPSGPVGSCCFLPAWTGSTGWSSVFCVAQRSG